MDWTKHNTDVGKPIRAPKLKIVEHLQVAEKAREEKKKFDERLMQRIERGEI